MSPGTQKRGDSIFPLRNQPALIPTFPLWSRTLLVLGLQVLPTSHPHSTSNLKGSQPALSRSRKTFPKSQAFPSERDLIVLNGKYLPEKVLLCPSGISAHAGQISGACCLEHRSKAWFLLFPSPNGVFFSLGQLWERFYYQRKVNFVSSLILPHRAIRGPEPLGNHPGPLEAPWRFFQCPSNRLFLSASVEWDESMGDPGGLFRPWIIYTHWVILHFRLALFYACNF